MWTFWLQLMWVSASVLLVTSSGAGRHSLWVLATCVSGPSQLPEFSLVLMLDDLQVAYYDSTLDHLVASSRDRTPVDLGQSAMRVVHEIQSTTRNKLEYARHRFNRTRGLHVQQKLAGCEVQDGRPTFIMSRNGYDGQDADSLMYNTTHLSYTVGDGWESRWKAAKWQYVQIVYPHVYLPTCASVLRQLLEQKKKLVSRRVRPRLRVLSRQVKGGALLTCLATDFYPRHIDLTLLRDGHRVREDRLSTGPVLPNANGLYQVRKTLVLTEAELRQERNYTCAAAHLSLDNRLQVSWRAESFRSHRAHALSPLVLGALVLLLLLLLVLAKRGAPQEPGAGADSVGAEHVAMVTDTS